MKAAVKNLPLCSPVFPFCPPVLVLSSLECHQVWILLLPWPWVALEWLFGKQIRGNSGRFLKSPVSCLLPFLDPGCLRGALNCRLAQPCTQTSSAWHEASSCWGSSPCGCSCRQHPLQASMGGWEGYLRIFFRYFHRITGVLQVPGCCIVRARGAVVGVGWDEPGRCGAQRSATVSCATVPPLLDSSAQPEPPVSAGPRAEVPRGGSQAPAPP